jgi:branched-chain amino acid transport system ATP-binding protein
VAKKMALLELRNVKKRFGSVVALDKIDLDIYPGEVLGIVGPNGSGKTTLLNVISGYHRPSTGTITYHNQKITGLRADKTADRGIIRTFQQNMVYWDAVTLENIVRACYLSCRTNLWQAFFNTRAYIREESEILQTAKDIVKTFGLADYTYSPALGLPHGKQRSLGMAIALAAKPELLLLDEPLAGMDGGETEIVADNIKKIIDSGVTVMLVEHNIKSVLWLCSRIIVLDFGLKIADGKPEEVLKSKNVVEAYLGVD